MAYWITLRKGDVRRGFSAATAQEALAVFEANLAECYEVRIVHPDGYEVSANALRLIVDRMKVEA